MLNLLVVDDDSIVAETMRMGLEDYCCADVVCTRTGTSALELMRVLHLDAVLIDASLPDITGFEVADYACQRSIPALITTGHPDSVLVCRHYGYPFLKKPFLPSTLAERTRGLIRLAQENVAMVRASNARLRQVAGDLGKVIMEGRRLVEESRRARVRNQQIRYQPPGHGMENKD
jgi:DNA-binding response OmpR family regulator